jgi:superfamily II DNA/RNA helicase
MNLSEPVLKAIRRKGFRLPTPIQRKTLPLILQVRAAAQHPLSAQR